MVREQSVPVDIVELTLARMRETSAQDVLVLGGVEAEQGVEPLLDGVVHAVSDRLIELHFSQGPSSAKSLVFTSLVVLHPLLVLFSEGVKKLERQGSAGSLVAMDGGGEHDHVGSEQVPHNGDRDGSGLIDNEEFGLSELGAILRPDVLDSLSVVAMDVDSHNCMVEVGVCAGQDVVVLVLLIVEGIEALEYKLEDGTEVLW